MVRVFVRRTNASMSKSGPSRMATTQDNFRKEIERRFKALRDALSLLIEERNELDLPANQIDESGPNGPRDIVQQSPADIVDDFEFSTRAGREASFQTWWEDAVESSLIEPIDRDAILNGEHYSAAHLDNGYKKGIKWADPRLKEFGVDIDDVDVATTFELPIHQDTARTLYTRTYGQLESVAEHTEQEVARILTDEVAAGEGPRSIARTLTNEVQSIQRTRGRMVARTEVMNAHAYATGNRYQEYGVEWANIITFEPCSQCVEFRDGGPYPVREVQSALPIHPNCVCAMVPASPPNEGGESVDFGRGTTGPDN